MMVEKQDYPTLLVSQLPWIDRVAAALCRRHGLDPDEADDFTSAARARLVEDDYAVLRKFRGESAITTYLTVVMNRFYQDYRVAQWGRWRPSAAAKRQGTLAVLLETRVHRDGLTVAQAVESLRAGGWPNLTEREASTLVAGLPNTRGRPKQVDEASLESAPSDSSADGAVLHDEVEARRGAMREMLGRAMEGLSGEDREIVKMRFFAGSTVAEIARALRTEQKPLYRRLERILTHLRRALEAEGISAEQVREIADEEN